MVDVVALGRDFADCEVVRIDEDSPPFADGMLDAGHV